MCDGSGATIEGERRKPLGPLLQGLGVDEAGVAEVVYFRLLLKRLT